MNALNVAAIINLVLIVLGFYLVMEQKIKKTGISIFAGAVVFVWVGAGIWEICKALSCVIQNIALYF